ncbi:MAG: hypothetical protein EZS28_012576, partial [Streblomastix strix]
MASAEIIAAFEQQIMNTQSQEKEVREASEKYLKEFETQDPNGLVRLLLTIPTTSSNEIAQKFALIYLRGRFITIQKKNSIINKLTEETINLVKGELIRFFELVPMESKVRPQVIACISE